MAMNCLCPARATARCMSSTFRTAGTKRASRPEPAVNRSPSFKAMRADLPPIADRLIEAYDTATMLPPITTGAPEFSVADGYAVLAEIEARRRAQGWRSVGRKIGFTNRTIWPRYGVYQPMWAHVWSHTVRFAEDGKATLDLTRFVQPRIEPEVVF